MMGKMFERRKVLPVACFALAACTNLGNRGSPAAAQAAGHAGTVITVGSFDFPESVLLASIYADALAAKGFPAQVLPNLGTCQLVDTALVNGMIQHVPPYAGLAQDFMSLDCARRR
jgi:osmoprotectant transport system substrate-binding protein